MNKRFFLTSIGLVLLGLIITSCKLPASGAPQIVPTQAPVITTPTSSQLHLPTSTSLPSTPVVVTATSVPPTAVPATPIPATSVPPAPTSLQKAIRIQFPEGGISASINGELGAGQTLYYVLKALSSQTMNVKVSSPTGDVYLGVAGVDGTVLQGSDGKDTTFSGILPATQDYYLSLTASGATSSYTLSVEIPPLTAGPTSATTPVIATFDPLATYGQPTFDDPMDGENIDDWLNPSTGLLPDTNYIKIAETSSKFYVTGKLVPFNTWYFTWRELSDFYLQATFSSGTCTGKDAYGLIIRGPQHLAGAAFGYVVAFSCDGSLWVFRLDSANPYSAKDLLVWTPSEFIAAGAGKDNTMGIKAVGHNLTIYANGHQVADIFDSKYTSGRYGLFVNTELTKNYTYQVVNISYWDLSR